MANNSNNLDRNTKAELPWAISIGFGLLTLGYSWHIFLAITVTSGLGLAVRRFQQQQKQQQELLNSLFYQLIEENQGRITTLDLAMKAKLPANVVQEFLDRQATDFSAHYEITDLGGIIYYFPTAVSPPSAETEEVDGRGGDSLSNSSVGSKFNYADGKNQNTGTNKQFPEEEAIGEAQAKTVTRETLNDNKINLSSKVPQLLNQVQLANRLSVHPSTISKRKTKSDFLQWSSEKDPEAIAWQYSLETKRFSPAIVE